MLCRILSRRSLVTSAAALPALAVPAVAVAAITSVPDPIFAAIEAFEHARNAQTKALHNNSEAQGQFRDEFGSFGPDALSKKAREYLAGINPKFATAKINTHEIITSLKKTWLGQPRARWVIAEMHRELNLQTAAYNERVETLNLAADHACDIYNNTLTMLVNTEPTTPVGMAAALTYVHDNMDIDGPLQDGDDIKNFIGTVAKAAAALADWRCGHERERHQPMRPATAPEHRE